jgi:tRNA modification GTPase
VAHADLSLLVVDARDLVESKTANLIQQHVMPLLTPSTLLFVNKIDSIHPESTDQDGFLARINHTFPSNQYWAGSIHTGAGMPEFISNLAEHLRVRFDPATGAGDSATQAPLITHARHRAHLEKSLAFLDAFSKNSTHPGMIVCAAEDLRYAARAIGQVTGTIETDDVLDAVFGQFCIGK